MASAGDRVTTGEPSGRDLPEQVYADAARAFCASTTGDALEPKMIAAVVRAADFRRTVESAYRAGRRAAAEAIVAHAMRGGLPQNAARRTLHRHLRAAASVAQGPSPLSDVAEGFARGDYAACYLDEAGRPTDA